MKSHLGKAVLCIGFAAFAIFNLSQATLGATLAYEIYSLQPGDTRENLAARHGLTVEEIISIDDGAWQPGKRVALLKRYFDAPQSVESTSVNASQPWMANVIRSESHIRSQPGRGETLFVPDLGTKVIVIAENERYYGVVMADRSTGWVDKSALSLEEPMDQAHLQTLLSEGRPEIVEEAFRYLGLPYRYGGHLPYDTDCSLLVQTVFRSKGANLPRTAAEQSKVGKVVTLDEILAGDRLYFIDSKGRIDHTGIYIGNGKFIHASSKRKSVAVDKLEGTFLSRLVVIRR